MTILLTGAAGFIGSHVLDRLLARGKRVTAVDCFEPRVHADLYRQQVPKTGTSVPLIVRRCGEVTYSDISAADVVIHLAAQVGVADSMTDPHRYIRDNTVDTLSFLETIAQARHNGRGPRRLVVASSMSVY